MTAHSTFPQTSGAGQGSIQSNFVVFQGATEEEPGYGVKTRKSGEVVYDAYFYQDTAARIANLLDTSTTTLSWEELERQLARDAYDTRFVRFDTENKEVSPGRRYLRQGKPT